jgi:hypothetical protein
MMSLATSLFWIQLRSGEWREVAGSLDFTGLLKEIEPAMCKNAR